MSASPRDAHADEEDARSAGSGAADVEDGAGGAGVRAPADAPWWDGRLAFECTACGKCCLNHGEGYEFVFSTVGERRALAAHFGIPLREFERRYCERKLGALTFASRGDACIFLDAQGRCSVYALRPTQCRTFPFWPELLEDESTWQRDVASFCPGVGRGPPLGRDEIEAAMRRAGHPR